MTKWIETTGRSEEDAIAAALFQLGLDRDDVSVEVIERAKEIYNWYALSKILKNNPGGRISDAKVEDYRQHKTDLALLKKVLKEHFPKELRYRILNAS